MLRTLLLSLFLMLVCAAYSPGQTNSDSGADRERLVRELDDQLAKAFAGRQPGVVVLLARNGVPQMIKAYGCAEVATGRRLEILQPLPVGSISKQFTAVAVFQLIGEGKLSLEDQIVKWFPSLGRFSGVTVHHLLTHASGIPDVFNLPDWRGDLRTAYPPQEALELIARQRPVFPPGEKVSYSNSGYIILGLLVEKVSGTSYAQFLRSHIFSKIGATKSSVMDKSTITKIGAKGYDVSAEEFRPAPTYDVSRYFGGGSVVTTVSDLLLWDNALETSKLLSPRLLEGLFRPIKLLTGEISGAACGWEVIQNRGTTIYGHGGGISGFSAQVYRVPDQKLYVAVLGNATGRDKDHSVTAVAQRALSVLLETRQESSAMAKVMIPREGLKSFAGTYRLPDGSDRRIVELEGLLYYVADDRTRAPLTAEGPFTFTAGRGSRFRFESDSSGNVISFELFTGRGVPVIGRRIHSPQLDVPFSAGQLKMYLGTFKIQNEGKEQIRKIVAEGEQLFYVADNDQRIPLRPESSRRFFLYPSATSIDFTFGSDGRVDSLIVRTGSGRVMPGQRIE
jgi:CubicO group peptidase (beta-lactamase class C family)